VVRLSLAALAVCSLLLASCSGDSSDSARHVAATRATTTTTGVASTTPSTVAPATTGQGGGGGSATTTAAPPPPTTAGPAKPTITMLNMPGTVSCTSSTTITASWSYANATSLTISIDGPGAYNTYGPTGSDALPFACDGNPHKYTFAATGPGGTTTTTNTVLQQ
jgi:hypothetical protein